MISTSSLVYLAAAYAAVVGGIGAFGAWMALRRRALERLGRTRTAARR